jgi:N-acetylglucosamine malate deacetylase 1
MTRFLLILKRMKNYWINRAQRNQLLKRAINLYHLSKQVAVDYGVPQHAARILVLAPHPDDESIGCGGTLALLADSGIEVDAIFLTSGSPSGERKVADTREQEARNAAAVLGIRSLRFLRGRDGQLHFQLNFADMLRQVVRERRYDIVFCPWPYDAHSDHAATFAILAGTADIFDVAAEVWLYEVWSPLLANRFVAIDTVLNRKLTAIGCHASQVGDIDYCAKARALAEYRAISFYGRGIGHAEAFLVCDSATFRDLAQRVLGG